MRIVLISLLTLSTCNAFSQNIDLPLDSIKTLLCKKWEVSYALMGNTRIDQLPGATELNFEFLKDGTVVTSSNPTDRDKTKGKWSYEPSKKHIKIITNNKNTVEIIDLNEQMFVMQMNTDKNEFPSGDLKTIFKPKLTVSNQQMQKQMTTSQVQIKNTSLKNTDSAILYIGVENMIEIEGAQNNVSITVTGATIKKVGAAKFIVSPSKPGRIAISVSQDFKMIAIKEYTAVLQKK